AQEPVEMPDGGKPPSLPLALRGLLALPDRPVPIGQGLALGSPLRCQPAARVRPLPPEPDAEVPTPTPVCSPPRPRLKSSGRQGGPSSDGPPQPLSKTWPHHPNRLSRVARFGPTTQTRARRPFDASVGSTEASASLLARVCVVGPKRAEIRGV